MPNRSEMLEKWSPLFPAASVDLIMHWWRYLAGHYDAHGRHFHTLAHPYELTMTGEQYFGDLIRPLRLAIWFHDLVMEPGSQHNEADSGIIARFILTELGIPKAEIELVVSLIEMTHDHRPTEPIGEKLSDLDMRSLGSSPEQYRAGSLLIRREYAGATDAEFALGRRWFIDNTLSQEQIFYTPQIRDEYEDQARTNLKDELAELEAS